MVRFVLFGFKGEDGVEFRGRSAWIEKRVFIHRCRSKGKKEKRVNVKKKGVLE